VISTWVAIIDNSGKTDTTQVQRDYFSAASVRYVRVKVTGATSSVWASFYEFEVYGAESSGVTPSPTQTPNDSTPDEFHFKDVTEVKLNTVITSQPISVTGINMASVISITGGEYRINSGGWTSQSGAVISGDAVTVRLTSATSYATTKSAVLSIQFPATSDAKVKKKEGVYD
jgi:hypothetical protein